MTPDDSHYYGIGDIELRHDIFHNGRDFFWISVGDIASVQLTEEQLLDANALLSSFVAEGLNHGHQ